MTRLIRRNRAAAVVRLTDVEAANCNLPVIDLEVKDHGSPSEGTRSILRCTAIVGNRTNPSQIHPGDARQAHVSKGEIAMERVKRSDANISDDVPL
ncbi:hypothetical protein [Bradyrhizobium sp. Ec3.3]|uniref:hypothetical protein n=1 Tax=Bradyrhizobium sp. Ec3.3 TaxID=189753 RepID=UPI0012EC21B6|nr:hypothetical protein [Bradyrhizobium sp. Ec3.3]